MIHWIDLFEEIGVPWRNTGKNTSKRNVNICCPFCYDDYGYHLACSIEKPVYYCYRDPQAHSGYHLVKLLVALGSDYVDAQRLLKKHSGDYTVSPLEIRKESTNQELKWNNSFEPITQLLGLPFLRYMQGRGFPNAEEVANRYDLRFVQYGKRARRLFLPIIEDGSVVGWTGRDIDGRIPKYLADEHVHVGMVMAPRLPRDKAIIVEGPLDALKIVASQQEWAALAVMGKAIPQRKLARMQKLLRKCKRILYVPDADVGVARFTMFDELNIIAPGKVELASIPPPYKDAGEMDYSAIRNWLGDL